MGVPDRHRNGLVPISSCTVRRSTPAITNLLAQLCLGHASVTLTLDTYSHVLPTMQEGAAKRLEGLLFENRS